MEERLAIELANATKEEKLGLAIERRTRADANEGLELSRMAEAEENRSVAALNRAKTMTEISKLEDERLFKVIEFVNALEQTESSNVKVSALENEARVDEVVAEVEDNPVPDNQAPQERGIASQLPPPKGTGL